MWDTSSRRSRRKLTDRARSPYEIIIILSRRNARVTFMGLTRITESRGIRRRKREARARHPRRIQFSAVYARATGCVTHALRVALRIAAPSCMYNLEGGRRSGITRAGQQPSTTLRPSLHNLSFPPSRLPSRFSDSLSAGRASTFDSRSLPSNWGLSSAASDTGVKK